MVANDIWIAAPILPGIPEKTTAEILHELVAMSDDDLQFINPDLLKKTGINHDFYKTNGVTFLRSQIISQIQTTKFFTVAYMHVDGASFAAPIVSEVIAQLLQAQPLLTPRQIRRALFNSAKRISGIPVEQQGYGYIQPKIALLKL